MAERCYWLIQRKKTLDPSPEKQIFLIFRERTAIFNPKPPWDVGFLTKSREELGEAERNAEFFRNGAEHHQTVSGSFFANLRHDYTLLLSEGESYVTRNEEQ